VNADRTRVLIADDHTLLLDALSELLSMEADIEIVGKAGDADAVVTVAAQVQPDVVLLDVEMPGNPAAETMRRIGSVSPRTKTIVLSMYDDAPLVRELLAAGARGYLHKGVSRQDLVAAIRGVRRDPHRLIVSVSQNGFTTSSAPEGGPLSDRELQVLTLAARAMSNRQIAGQLAITEGTVKRHLRNIFRKLSAVSRIDAVNKAIAAALIDDPTERRRAGRKGTA
jgi:DNA-binding NarL/FixJ family response regulator